MPARAHCRLAGRSTFKSLIWKDKCSWEIQMRNTVEKYSWEIHLNNTVEKYCWDILLRNTVAKTVLKHSWGWRGVAHLNHGYERINVAAAAAPCILYFMEMQSFERAALFPWRCSHFDIQYSNSSTMVIRDEDDHVIVPTLDRYKCPR